MRWRSGKTENRSSVESRYRGRGRSGDAMSNRLILHDPRSESDVSVVGRTQIGRATNLHWAVPERQTPGVHDTLELVIAVRTEESPSRVSRNHAAITQNHCGDFYLTDLNSLNGTTLNGTSIRPDTPTQLDEGDVIHLSGRVPLHVAEILPNTEQHHAVLVSGSGTDCEAIMRLSEMLRGGGFGSDTTVLRDPTRSELIATLQQLAMRTTSASRTIFAYTGPSLAGALDLRDGGVLFARELYESFCFRGRKALVLDCRDADSFVTSRHLRHLPSRTTVLHPRGPEGISEAYIEPTDVATQHSLLVQALTDAIADSSGSCRLAEVAHDLEIAVVRHRPANRGIQDNDITIVNLAHRW